MASRTNTTRTRRLSLDLIHKAVSSDGGISRYMDLRLNGGEVTEVGCECCGLAEDCTRAHVRRVKDRFCGRWVCGLCSEAVVEELGRLGLARHVVREEALRAHMEVCGRFNRVVRVNPAMSLAGALVEILKKSSQRGGDGDGDGDGGGGIKRGPCKLGSRRFSDVPSHGA